MLGLILHKAKLRKMPILGISLVDGELKTAEANVTFHQWKQRFVKVTWSRAPALGELTEINALLTEGPQKSDPLLEHLKLLSPAAREGVVLGVVASLLRNDAGLRLRLGVPLDD